MDRFIKTACGALIAANVVMFIILQLALALGASPSWFGLIPLPRPAVWTPLTYMFTNTGFLDLLFNCLWLWLFASMVTEIGTERQLLVSYLVGGLCGGVFFIIFGALGICRGELFGASAAVLGVVAFAAVRAPYMRLNLMFFGAVKFAWIGAIAAILSLLPLLTGGVESGIAHLGGLIGGAGYALALKFKRPKFKIISHNEKKSLDQLLDKVKRSGYASLTPAERKQLLEYSNKL
ncbi:MAG: rhomboid family intramembrane serine protease [Bacteroides sp.]|nr:rhomboid family intramembrane serine protease [Bacteroides sp.]MCM1379874.1 rhomboid family intramembrane serine protease [Bacteroides sp.]MCM1446094.1 rhomboid family intramembrane serine protease [Prevotella sp.]